MSDYLLDTCTFLWMADDKSKLSTTATDILVDNNNRLYSSTASSWEITLKYSLGKIKLKEKPNLILPKIRETYQIELLAIEEKDVFKLSDLSDLHKDPFDRLLISQSIIRKLTLITPDRAISQYGLDWVW